MKGSKNGGGGQTSSSSQSQNNKNTNNSSSGGGGNVMMMISMDSPLPPIVQRCLGDRSYEKRKMAALEVEGLIQNLLASQELRLIPAVISVLAKEFCTSMNSNYRKGGLIGIAATAIGLTNAHVSTYLPELIPPVLHCLDDPESRVRYYACESLYNIAKVSRGCILTYFHPIFDGLTKLFADVDVDVKNGANLLDRLMKDIVTEHADFNILEFLPLLQTYIRRTNPYIRQLLIGWITVLDSIPDVSMIDYLPDFLDGLIHMLSDHNRDIRQAADSALSDFLRDLRQSTVIEFGPIISILVVQCHSPDRLNRLTSISWLSELIHHPYSGGNAILPHHSEVLGAVMKCLNDAQLEIRTIAQQTNADLLTLVRDDTSDTLDIPPLLDTVSAELRIKEDVPTKMASLQWINMLLDKRRADMEPYLKELLPVLLHTLSDSSDAVVLCNLEVLSRIALPPPEPKPTPSTRTTNTTTTNTNNTTSSSNSSSRSKSAKFAEMKRAELRKRSLLQKEELQLQYVLGEILQVFCKDRTLLETRASLIVRKLCVLLNAKSVYMRMAEALSADYPLEFIATMVQTLNLILLTASELHTLRLLLSTSFIPTKSTTTTTATNTARSIKSSSSSYSSSNEGIKVFHAIFTCWCHNPVATFSLCLLAQAYDLAFCLVKKFSELEVTVGFLMQMDKLVLLLESPIFVHVRLQLLNVEAPHHVSLLKSCYGLLMLLPQSNAFHALNDRLTTVCNLRDNLQIPPSTTNSTNTPNPNIDGLLTKFDQVIEVHRKARQVETQEMTTTATTTTTTNTTIESTNHKTSTNNSNNNSNNDTTTSIS